MVREGKVSRAPEPLSLVSFLRPPTVDAESFEQLAAMDCFIYYVDLSGITLRLMTGDAEG
jgi:hypothetical protein